MNRRKILADMIKSHCLLTGDFTLSSGQKTDRYIDLRQLTLSAQGITTVTHCISDKLRSHEIEYDAVAGNGVGAIPLVGAFLFSQGSYFMFPKTTVGFAIRNEPKQHGTASLVEGPGEKGKKAAGKRVVILEDVTTIGQSAMRAAQAIEAEGGSIVAIISILDRLQGAKDLFDGKYFFRSLVTIEDLKLS